MSLAQFTPLFLPSCCCHWKFLFLSSEKKVYKRFQRFPQAIIQAGEREEEEETVDNPGVEEEGAEENAAQPSVKEPSQQEAQFVFLSLSCVSVCLLSCLLEDSRHPALTQLVGGLHRHADGGWFQSSLLQETECILKSLLAESINNLRKTQKKMITIYFLL